MKQVYISNIYQFLYYHYFLLLYGIPFILFYIAIVLVAATYSNRREIIRNATEKINISSLMQALGDVLWHGNLKE